MTRIWDTFIFGTEDELDVLECRLATLEGAVDGHIIAESRWTHQGQPKPLVLPQHAARFAQWDDRIMYLDAGAQVGKTTWAREGNQRNSLVAGLAAAGAEPSDIVMHGDVDEIPRPEHVGRVGHTLGMLHLPHSLWWKAPHYWAGTTADYLKNLDMGDGGDTLADLRMRRFKWPMIPAAGWHVSWQGGPTVAARKLHTSAHTDFPAWFQNAVRDGSCWRDGIHWEGGPKVKLTRTARTDWPPWCRDHAPATWTEIPHA